MADRTTQRQRSSRHVLFIDEIDVLCPQRSTSASAAASSSADRLTGQLLTLMDGWKGGESTLLVLAATNHPHTVDAALRRPGRFDVEVELPPPAADERQRILHYYTRGMQLSEEAKVGAAWLSAVLATWVQTWKQCVERQD